MNEMQFIHDNGFGPVGDIKEYRDIFGQDSPLYYVVLGDVKLILNYFMYNGIDTTSINQATVYWTYNKPLYDLLTKVKDSNITLYLDKATYFYYIGSYINRTESYKIEDVNLENNIISIKISSLTEYGNIDMFNNDFDNGSYKLLNKEVIDEKILHLRVAETDLLDIFKDDSPSINDYFIAISSTQDVIVKSICNDYGRHDELKVYTQYINDASFGAIYGVIIRDYNHNKNINRLWYKITDGLFEPIYHEQIPEEIKKSLNYYDKVHNSKDTK